MACLVLPSETARLVYGYLVKEKLDNIALQFLENSPYLTDCYHIVKSGYHFNTKFLYRELHELIQEYSTIQNLVNKKIGNVPKTSALYKRIKLRCETLSEIVDLLLFWRNNIKSSDKSKKDKSISFNQSDSNAVENKELVDTFQSEDGDSMYKESVSTGNLENDRAEIKSGMEVFGDANQTLNNEFLHDDNCCDAPGIHNNPIVENLSENNAEILTDCDAPEKLPIPGSENKIGDEMKDNGDMTMNLGDMGHGNLVEASSVEMQNEADIDGQVKILRVEKETINSQSKNSLATAFSQSLDVLGSSMNIENGQVLYVSPDVGNLAVNQDQNQIIVIPIDYYKPQGTYHNDMEGNDRVQIQELIVNSEKNLAANSGIIYEDVTASSSAVAVTPSSLVGSSNGSKSEKSLVDDGIITEGTFLQNKDIIYELESKIRPQIFREIAPAATGFIQSVPEPQVIAPPPGQKPPREKRYRQIFPRKAKQVEVNPVIVVQPLVECNSASGRTNKTVVASKVTARRRNVKVAKKSTTTVKESEVRDMINIKSPVRDKNPENNNMMEIEANEVNIGMNSEKVNEEKENFAASEKKTETPIVIVNKNSKRLSLSTPRRKSHIRALEFETPPKTKNDKKKSRTSPKVKVEEMKIKNQSVRNTLFKSPDSEIVFKTPSCFSEKKSPSDPEPLKASGSGESGTDKLLLTPELEKNFSLALTRKTDENCRKSDADGERASKKSWDSDLRYFINCSGSSSSNDSGGVALNEKKRTRKTKKNQKDDRKSTKKSNASPGKPKLVQPVPSPSKISFTAKRNTYSISGNEGSPVHSLLEELDLVTPFKDSESNRPAEETPLTKLIRENISRIDIDLSMITTPVFPPTPSILITPDVDDSSGLTGACYYSPRKESAKEGKAAKSDSSKKELLKIEDYVQSDSEQSRKRDAKEIHDKAIGELVSKAKEIAGLQSEGGEENTIKKPLSGKVLSMVKIQMITQCDKKLCENIPINEGPDYDSSQLKCAAEDGSEEPAKFDLKDELEEKRKRALEKIKAVKENLTVQTRKKVTRQGLKRKRNDDCVKSAKRTKNDSMNESSSSDKGNDSSVGDCKASDSVGSGREALMPIHSTPNPDRSFSAKFGRDDSAEKLDGNLLNEIREEFPSFQDDGEYPELPLKTRKKLYYIKHFLKSEEIVRFFENSNGKKRMKLELKRSHRKFFQVFYKWLKHPHGREVNTSENTKVVLKEYRNLFETIRKGISRRGSGQASDCDAVTESGSVRGANGCQNRLRDDSGDRKGKKGAKTKEDETEDGPVSILPLKKRKAPVHPVEMSGVGPSDKCPSTENTSRTQNFLQDIDVDRFLFHIHGQENR